MTSPDQVPSRANGFEPEELPAAILLGQNRVLSLLARGEHLDRVLGEFCHVLEYAVPDARCCVTLMHPGDDSLHVAAAPSLPPDFREAIDGTIAGLGPGTCSSACHRNDVAIATDMASDPLWNGMREEILAAGLRSSWSSPIRGVRWARDSEESDEIRVLGSVALYFDEQRPPSRSDLRVLEMSSALAGLAINTARIQERVGRQQLYDSVTGLPNRKLFSDSLRQSLASMTPHADKLAVMLIDLDQFKEVNDTFGYAVGDFLLRSVAERLIAYRRPTDLLARFGDDEFVFLIGDVERNDEIKDLAKKMLSAVSKPYDFSGQQLGISCTLGASLYPWDGEDAQTLLRNAENALYAAKRQGRNRFRLYAPTMGAFAFEKLQLKMALGYAIENRELEVLYQPKIDSQSGRIQGAEALVYWNHPTEGRLSPSKFIPLAEETGLINPIGEWVLETVSQKVVEWRRSGNDDLVVAVNISAVQFRDPQFVDKVAAILNRAELSPEALELEITETVAMTEVDKTMARMRQLEALGVRMAIDDFGTGYSSLAYLKRFPIHTLKVDRSFVLKIPEDKENTAIVKAVIAMAHLLGLQIVAEGVETAEQATFLRHQGCELLQGFHFFRPLSAEKFAEAWRSSAAG